MKKACVLCNGCPESRIDSARVQNFLIANGWAITEKLEHADLILFRACGLTDEAAQKCFEVVGRVEAAANRNSRFIVWGCLPKIDPSALRRRYRGITFGEKEVSVLNEIVDAEKPIEEIVANHVLPRENCTLLGLHGFFYKLAVWVESRFSITNCESVFHIKACTGCLGKCSFCAVRKSRGVISSKSVDEVLSEFRYGLKLGFQQFGLLGTDLGAYGRDQGHNLVDLLSEMTNEKGNYKIGLRNVNPYHLNEMLDDLRPVFSTGKIWFLSSAAESGSNRILKLMRRRYSVQDFKKCIQTLNTEYPDILLRTQLIVGFPTETEEDFRMTLSLIDELRFHWVEVYKFSPKNGTLAASMAGQVDEKKAASRFRQLYVKTVLQQPYRKMKHLLYPYIKEP